ncbi:microcephalin-like [Xyrauchen texanus]|uniref:microcephalin-like n=1 Tax=Xyrauchen texanus TaxID=154827 RepID=UPI0022428712|nr:microcephalin-like [Xyrauchen texanus]
MTGRSISIKVLKDVVAYVDVWSASRMEDYSNPFIQQLQDMGAEVSKTLNKQVTHVVFKHGRLSTWKKAQKMGVRVVSVQWVARCKESGEHIDEDLFPAQNEVSKLNFLNKRTHRCMQPRDIPTKTPENDRRMKRKLDKMMEGLISSSPVVSDTSPFIIDEENGILYSPSLKRSDSMAQRLREMRAQREHLSPTASQMQDSGSGSDVSLRPSLGASPTLSFLEQLEDEPLEEDLDCFSTSHYHSSKNKDERGNQNWNKETTAKIASKQSNQTPESNTLAMCTLSSVERNPKVLTLSTKRSRKSSMNNTGGKKQATLESFVHKISSECEQISDLKSQSENTERSRGSSGGPERPESSLPENLVKTNKVKLKQRSKEVQTNSKRANSRKSSPASSCVTENENNLQKSEPSTHKPVSKVSKSLLSFSAYHSAGMLGNPPSRDDGEVFDDLFSPANNVPKQRDILIGLEAVHLSTFDLVDSNKKRKGGRKRKHENIELKDILIGTSGYKIEETSIVPETPESRPQRLCVGMPEVPETPRVVEIKHEPLQKKQRRRTRLCSVLSEGEDGKSSVKTSPADEKKVPIAASLASSTAVNVKLQIQKDLKTDPKHVVGKENRSTTDGLNERTSEMCTKWATVNKDKYMKKYRSLVMTSMPTEKQEVVFQLVRTLGGFTVVDDVCESTTHVVSGSPRRTLNVLLGIARGCWILSFEWILWCLEHRQWVPEEPYELSDHFPAAPICRLQQHLSAGEHQQDLFQDQPLMFVSPHSQPPCSSLTELIQLCGGTVCRSVRQAGICIGEYKGKKPDGSRSLSEQWVLDSVTHLTLVPYENYILE